MAHPRYAGRPVYFTDAIVRADSPARTFADLRGTVWAYNDAGSNSGYVMPRHHLLTLGETRGYFARAVASGSHQQSIRWVVDRTVDAAGIDSTVLELELTQCSALAPAVRVVESIGPCPIPPVVAGRHLPEARTQRLREVFLTLHEDREARVILAEGQIAQFVPVKDADYDPIREMVRCARAAGFLTLR
jgi:phosphonate transport system substrate-binding protein